MPELHETHSASALVPPQGLSVGVPFPFQAVMGLILVSFTSGLLLYVIPSAAALIQHPLQTSGLVASLAGACGLSVLAPLLFRLVRVLMVGQFSALEHQALRNYARILLVHKCLHL